MLTLRCNVQRCASVVPTAFSCAASQHASLRCNGLCCNGLRCNNVRRHRVLAAPSRLRSYANVLKYALVAHARREAFAQQRDSAHTLQVPPAVQCARAKGIRMRRLGSGVTLGLPIAPCAQRTLTADCAGL